MAEEVHFHGGALASNSELSRYILDNQEYLISRMLGLKGVMRVMNLKGQYEYITVKERSVNDQCKLFIKEKIEQIFNKNTFLAEYSAEDMWRTQQAVSIDFNIELWQSAKEFELTVERYTELCSEFRNVVDIGFRMALNQGIRKMLISTTSEQTQNVRQTISDTQEKRGGLFGFLGGK